MSSVSIKSGAEYHNYTSWTRPDWAVPEVISNLRKLTLQRLEKIHDKKPNLVDDSYTTVVAPGAVFSRRTELSPNITADYLDKIYVEPHVFYPYETDKDLILLNLAGSLVEEFCEEHGFNPENLGEEARKLGYDGILFYTESTSELPQEYIKKHQVLFDRADDRSGYQAILFQENL